MNLSLFELTADYRSAAEKLADLDLPPEVVADTLESLAGDLEIKAQNVAWFIRNLEVTIDAIKNFEEQQKTRRQAIERRADQVRAYLQNCLEAAGIKRIEGDGVVISFRKSQAVAVDEPGLLPIEFWRQPEPPLPQPDKQLIASVLKSGGEVPGAHLEQRENLQIK